MPGPGWQRRWPAVCVLARGMKAIPGAVAVVVLFATGCQTTVIPPSDGGFTAGDAGDPVDGATCNTISAAAPPVYISCPVGANCRDCPPSAGPGPIAEGRYVATETTLYASGCGIFADEAGTLVIEVSGSTMRLFSELPVLSGGRMTFTFAVSGDQITFNQICPASAGMYVPPSSAFRVWPDHLFIQDLQGTPGPTVFVKE